MIHLKEFATQAEYEAFVESGEMKKPNVSFITDTLEVFYTKAVKYENGVYVQHIDGKIFSADEWVEKGFTLEQSNGIAVVDDNCQFVIPNIEMMENRGGYMDNVDGYLVMPLYSNRADAEQDYYGLKNSLLLQTQMGASTSSTLYICLNYKFANDTQGYLPSAGELAVFKKKFTEIKATRTKIGAPSFIGGYNAPSVLSSTQRSKEDVWGLESREYVGYYIDNDNVSKYNSSNMFIPFGVLK